MRLLPAQSENLQRRSISINKTRRGNENRFTFFIRRFCQAIMKCCHQRVPILLITDVFDPLATAICLVPEPVQKRSFNSLQRPLAPGKLHVKARNPIRPDATGTHSSKDRSFVMFAGYLYESPAVNIK